jgi:hypothetical protein
VSLFVTLCETVSVCHYAQLCEHVLVCAAMCGYL